MTDDADEARSETRWEVHRDKVMEKYSLENLDDDGDGPGGDGCGE